MTSLKLICIRYSTIETKEAARIGYNGYLFPHEYSNLYNNGVVEKTNGMTFNPNYNFKIDLLIYISLIDYTFPKKSIIYIPMYQ